LLLFGSACLGLLALAPSECKADQGFRVYIGPAYPPYPNYYYHEKHRRHWHRRHHYYLGN
jgi:hypothetical protein